MAGDVDLEPLEQRHESAVEVEAVATPAVDHALDTRERLDSRRLPRGRCRCSRTGPGQRAPARERASVAASTVPRAASTPRCSRYAAAARSDSCWPSRIETLPCSPETRAVALHVPLAGEQPRYEAVEQAQRHAPEHVPFHLDALDLDRPLEVARPERQPPPLGRLAEVLDGRCEQPRDLVRLEPPLDVGRDDARGMDRRGSPSPSSRADRARRAPRPATAAARPPPRPREAPSRGSCPRRPAPGARPAGRAGRRGCPGRCGGASRIRSTPAPSRKTGASTAASSNSRAVVTPRCGAGRRPSRAVESAAPPRRRRARPRAG